MRRNNIKFVVRAAFSGAVPCSLGIVLFCYIFLTKCKTEIAYEKLCKTTAHTACAGIFHSLKRRNYDCFLEKVY